jgi:membrane-bound lytic murein transglycosylase B
MYRIFAFLLLFSTAACAVPEGMRTGQSFNVWLEDFRKSALSEGISQDTVDSALSDARVINRVIELDRKQPESTLTLEEYLAKVINAKRIEKGREMIAEHRDLLKKISTEYGVAPEYIVALWGIETNYGSNTGGYSTVSALATLAYEGRRSEFFRGELLNLLRILDADHISVDDVKGSWAGAMGQCQFMPSSFLNFAVDHDGDGKRDIWNTQADVFASIANYLNRSGWNNQASVEAKHKVLMKWNRSRYFVTAVTNLAHAIKKA